MSTFLFTHASDNLLTTAPIVLVQSGTEDSVYPATNINNLQPEKPAKLTTSTGAWVADLGSAQAVEMCAIIHHNLSAGLDVRLEGHTANLWTAPAFSQAFTIPTAYLDGYPVNVWLDVKTLVPAALSRTYRYWRLNVAGVNATAVSIGEWVLSAARRDLGVRNISWGSTRILRRPFVLHETEILTRRTYDLGTTIRTVKVESEPTDVTVSEILNWYRDALGAVRPFLIVPAGGPLGSTIENDAWFVQFLNADQPYIRAHLNHNTITMDFQEVARGAA
jgi:hypothetical protein